MFVIARWEFVPRWNRDANARIRPINAKAENIATSGLFKTAYRSRRALMPIEIFRMARKKAAATMKDGKPFCVSAIWDKRRDTPTGAEISIVTCPADELVGQIHNRVSAIIAETDYTRWLRDAEPAPARPSASLSEAAIVASEDKGCLPLDLSSTNVPSLFSSGDADSF